MVKEFVKGKMYNTGKGIGIFIQNDRWGDPMFKMIGKHKWHINPDGLAAFSKITAQKFEELPDEAV